VEKLERSIQDLERRVASLEAQLRERSAPPTAPSGKEGWRKLKIGMLDKEVEQLVGSPSKVEASQAITTWWFGTRGYVMFDAKSRKVERWSEP